MTGIRDAHLSIPEAADSAGLRFKYYVALEGGGMGVVKGVAGKIYYVDEENGSDGNDGLSPSTAFKTLEKCWGNTTDNKMARDDYSDDAEYHVFVAPGTYAPTLPLRLYGHGIHLHGLGIPGSDSGVNITDTAAVGATNGLLYLAGANCTIENVQFNMTTDIPAIYMIASDNCVIRNNRFKGTAGTTTYAIKTANIRSTHIINNEFGIAGQDFTHHIYGVSGADTYMIDCYIGYNRIFSDNTSATGIYVHVDQVAYGTVIDHNWINLATAGGTPIGIDWNSTHTSLITNNYVTVPSSKTPIESAASPTGILHNATQAGSTEVDPNTAAG